MAVPLVRPKRKLIRSDSCCHQRLSDFLFPRCGVRCPERPEPQGRGAEAEKSHRSPLRRFRLRLCLCPGMLQEGFRPPLREFSPDFGFQLLSGGPLPWKFSDQVFFFQVGSGGQCIFTTDLLSIRSGSGSRSRKSGSTFTLRSSPVWQTFSQGGQSKREDAFSPGNAPPWGRLKKNTGLRSRTAVRIRPGNPLFMAKISLREAS